MKLNLHRYAKPEPVVPAYAKPMPAVPAYAKPEAGGSAYKHEHVVPVPKRRGGFIKKDEVVKGFIKEEEIEEIDSDDDYFEAWDTGFKQEQDNIYNNKECYDWAMEVHEQRCTKYVRRIQDEHCWTPAHEKEEPKGAHAEKLLSVPMGDIWQWDKAISDMIRYREKGQWWRGWQRIMLASQSMRFHSGTYTL